MDDLDKDILKLLQSGDFCIPQNTKIAGKLGKPISSVRERIKKLREGGIVHKYVPLLDFSLLGWNTTSVVRIKFQQGSDVQKMIGELAEVPGIQEILWTEGEWNLFVKVRTKGEEALQELEKNRFLKMEGIKDFEVVRISKVYKESLELPV